MKVATLEKILKTELSMIGFVKIGKLLFRGSNEAGDVEHFVNFQISKEKSKKLTCEFGVSNRDSLRFAEHCITNFADRDGLYLKYYSDFRLPYNVRNSLLMYVGGEMTSPLDLDNLEEVDFNSIFLSSLRNIVLPKLREIQTLDGLLITYRFNSELFPIGRSNSAIRLAETLFLASKLSQKISRGEIEKWRYFVQSNLRNGVSFERYISDLFSYIAFNAI